MTQPQMKTAVISVQGMTCQGCVGKVQAAISAMPGVTQSRVDLQRGEAHLFFDPAVASIANLMEAVNKAGFRATGFAIGRATA